MSDTRQHGARLIHEAFLRMQAEFSAITRRGRGRFERCDWHGCETDAVERLGLYGRILDSLVDELDTLPEAEARHTHWWPETKLAYSGLLEHEPNGELARTFFNSIGRRMLDTQGVNPDVEFLGPGPDITGREPDSSLLRRYVPGPDGVRALLRAVLDDFRFDTAWRDADGDVARVLERIESDLASLGGAGAVSALELVGAVFYRMKHAYLVGRLVCGDRTLPLILPLLHEHGDGPYIDAVLLDEDEASIIFSFTRAYFHVEVERPRELLVFLRSILPSKPPAELYTAIGHDRHGKTVLYRDLRTHLQHSDDRFVVAPGDEGMVMLVFTLPSYDVVFKLIRDRFAPPKSTTADIVMQRYRMVFERDRVGRLVDAQSFEHLEFPRARFDDTLLEQLLRETSRVVRLDAERVLIDHLYTERRITPLNIYLRQAAAPAARDAVIEYGHSIRELAAANIFPGDFLLKNFGVTRHGRVVFYDYDELCLLTDCRFRRIPTPRTPEDEMADEPWFTVGASDVFPEEFRKFLGLSAELREVFERHHAELFDAEFWIALQRRHEAGEILDVYPYPPARRLGTGPRG